MKTVSLPYPPSANRYWRIAMNRLYPSAEAKAFKRTAAVLARSAGIQPTPAPMAVSVTLHPKLTKKGEASKTRIDLDNALKVTLDALNGIAWEDDSQVVGIIARIGNGIDCGGLTVEVAPA
jgi:crossover junction endodeoxyribonuclease RusA